jgi:6,7-dimethyl-8-ribityllumazine synthase
MPKIIEGHLTAQGLKLAIVVSRFNDFITGRLLEGATDAIVRSGGNADEITVVKVPGAFEMPLAAKGVATSKKYDGVVCLGAVIRGSTPHFDHVAAQVSRGLQSVMIESGVPVSFGVITADNLEQAIERAGSKHGNKGQQAALTVIEMVNVMKKL